ncbi:hypothetical protein Dimus_028247 [Dionaea muscipula]
MLTQYGIKLAVDIITTDFGKLVAQACECLLRRGVLTKSGIGRFSGLSSDIVKKCLWVLIQHNCVQDFNLEQLGAGGSITVSTHYMALFDNIIMRIRFSKILAIVSKEQDEQCAMLLEGLLQHGRLTLTQILEKAAEETNGGGNADANSVRERFFRLVTSHYVQPCPSPEPYIALPPEGDNPPKKKGLKKMFLKEVTLEDQALAAVKPMETVGFSPDTLSWADTEDIKNGNDLPSTKAGMKRKLDLLDVECVEKEPLWRVNFDQFKHLLLNKVCIENIRCRLDDKAGMVLNAMLKPSRSADKIISSSVDAVYEELLKSNLGLTLERVRSYLEQIGCHLVADDEYSIDLGNIIQQAQKEEVESIVLKRYGKEAYRMFRLLTNYQELETDKISDKTFVDKKETAKFLNRLWKDNFLLVEKQSAVTGGGPDGNKETVLWKANKEGLVYEVLDELYHAVLNLRIRSNHEIDQQREIIHLNKIERVGEASKRFKHLQDVTLLLFNSLMMVDDAILLFQ